MIRTGSQMENKLHENVSKKVGTRRAGKLYKARSPLYRSQILQVNSKYSLESSRRDLHNALLCTVLVESVWVKKYTKINIEKMKSGKS